MKQYLTLLFLALNIHLIAQIDFNNYKTLIAAGEIPADFSVQTSQKLADDLASDRSELSKNNEANFLEMIHYGIDNVLHSGYCVYGDPVSLYVTEVARNILKDDQELFNKLRFYTIKSNVANAFSTDQGIVFVTTGLISQFSNEAQLAFVLAHEISHFTEKHVVQSFDWNMKNRNHHDYLDQMSTYSKEKEFDADKIAVELCHKAGYSDNEVYNSFDVLMYSYLPFDEIEFPITYFNSSNYYIPEINFPAEKFEIKAEEDYNDDFSSHPNVKKRKDTVNVALSNFENWKDASFIVSEARFYETRTISRFESVRSDVLDGRFVNALYSIFILEKEYPTSNYLQKMKAHAWHGLMKYKINNQLSDAVQSNSELEGESATLHYLIKKMNKQALYTTALREVYDIKMAFPEDKDIARIFDKTIEKLITNTSFKLEDYSSKTFDIAANEFIARQDSLLNDTLKTVENTDEKATKYQRIKKKKDPNTIEGFDSTKYYIYGISDILIDADFQAIVLKHKTQFEIDKKAEENYNALSYRERKKVDSEAAQLGINELILVEPTVISYTRKGVDYVKSDKLETNLTEAIDYASKEVGTSIYNINRKTLAEDGTDAFNKRNTLFTLLSQIITTDQNDEGVLPIDTELLQEIQSQFGVSNVMFTVVENYYGPRLSPGGTVGMVFLPPFLPLYLIRAFASANTTELTYILIDTEKGIVTNANTNYYRSPVKKWYLRSQMYSIFNKINSKPQ